MLYGYAGKFLYVDLTVGNIREEELTREFAENYIGGYGFGARVLYDMIEKGADPLGPGNVAGFTTGPFNAAGVPMGGRYTFVCKSPVTGGWNDANSGGFFGDELKKAGYDALFVSGASETPVYIWINDGKVEIRDASAMWGLDCKQTIEAMCEDTGEKRLRAAVIGPAGENLSLFAAVINDGHRAAGRGGGGAVMGSKKLKGVAVRGTGKITVAEPEKLRELRLTANRSLANPAEDNPMAGFINGFKAYGTTMFTGPSALSGDSPVRNWGGSGLDDFGEEAANALNGPSFDSNYNVKKFGCASCPLACGAKYQVDKGKWPVGETDRPEYETLAAFGSNCLNKDIEAIIKCNDLCNTAGMDTITAGSVVAWVMECYEHGLLKAEDLDGIEAKWGDGEAMVALTEKMAKYEGCGKILALGQAGAAKAFGVGEEFLTVAGGIEPGMHDGRLPSAPGYNRIYKFDPTPGRHVKGGDQNTPADSPERGKNDAMATAGGEIMNCVGVCQFSGFAFAPGWQSQFMRYVTGFTFTDEEAYTAGIRIHLMRRAFNIREGISRRDMKISARLEGKPPLEKGPNSGVTTETDRAGDAFFKAIGCDPETGNPTRETAVALGGLDYILDIL
ncbi:MAG: aldehyde ferredoxin oxidoreductase family protein [Eubacteriaceae bacterium]|nr:aldehyde ferredoxin oxidoreductase family protein [Eubacteriaceae bacterium]